MFEIISSLFKYAFAIIIYLFILNVLRLIALDIRTMSQKNQPKGSFRHYLKLVSVQGVLDFKVEDMYSLEGDTTIGRAPGNTIPLNDPFLSAAHATMIKTRKTFYLKDNRSANGTYLNGKRAGLRPVRLKDGDRIILGRTEFLFVIEKGPGVR